MSKFSLVFVIDDEIQFSYRKRPLEIVGDGKSSIKELIDVLNSDTAYNIDINSAAITNFLFYSENQPDTILNLGEIVKLSENANPNVGAMIDDFRISFPDYLHQWAAKIARTLDLRLCGLDLFCPKNMDDDPRDFSIIEVNANPALKTIWKMGEHKTAFSIWEKVLSRSMK